MSDELLKLRNEIDRLDEEILARLCERARCAQRVGEVKEGEPPFYRPEREAQVLRLRYGIGTNHDHTLEEVGQAMGLTRERVRQIESAAIRKLRSPDFQERLRDYLAVANQLD